ncbi:MAG TPA: hypothetical protein VNF68_05330 [Candidatus Baltobacteraceae bacterium]|nr:hypothetical protein [Candidatus Baltobacteraceae bacterium]
MMIAAAGIPIALGVGLLALNRVRAPKLKTARPLLLNVPVNVPAPTDQVVKPVPERGVGVVDDGVVQAPLVASTVVAEEAVQSVEAPLECASDEIEISSDLETHAEVEAVPEVRVVPAAGLQVRTAEELPVFVGTGEAARVLPSRSVARVRRISPSGDVVETPIVLAADDTIVEPVTEELPAPETWAGVVIEREEAFRKAKEEADRHDAEAKAEEDRRALEVAALAAAELERQKNLDNRWWISLDTEAETDGERAALASSLSTVSMSWSRKILLRAMNEDTSTKVRARAIGAFVRAGFIDDPQPFYDILSLNDRLLTLAVREALAPHEELVWVRNIFA